MPPHTPSPTATLPPRPDLVLRVAFAGTRSLALDHPRRASLEEALRSLLSCMGGSLVDLAAGRGLRETPDGSTVTRFYSTNPPLVRLISGLAEGADDLAATVIEAMHGAPGDPRFELAGVLPFPAAEYRSSRSAAFQPRFDELVKQSAYIVELDGIYDPHDDARRHRAYRAQTMVLLRQGDLLLAVAEVSGAGRPGGTREALRAANAFGLPVVLLDVDTAEVRIIGPKDDVDEAMSRGGSGLSLAGACARLQDVTSELLAGPDLGTGPASDARSDYASLFLGEYFDVAEMPPARENGQRRPSWREGVFKRFENRYSPGDAESMDVPVRAYQVFRQRATSLNRHYTGLYRGTFLLNYRLAVVAVFLAALSLVILAGGLPPIAEALLARVFAPEPAARAPAALEAARTWLLLLLGVLKLVVVLMILRNTKEAKTGLWIERAVDSRYLAERLRTMFYLPRTGGFQPAPRTPGYNPRVVRQSACDWLFDAIVRHVSPRDIATATPDGPPAFAIDPAHALTDITAGWLSGQTDYHEKNAEKMKKMFRRLARRGTRRIYAVIGAVFVDAALLMMALLHVGPEVLHGFAPWLVFIAAVLPAAIAALNGIRFQSECQRLAERSDVMVSIIEGRREQADTLVQEIDAARADPATDPGSWTPAALRLAEAVATDMENEAAEWSVLYAKEIVEQ